MSLNKTYKLKSKVWRYPGMGGWHFINVPKKESTEIKKLFNDQKRGWGSLPVNVKIGQSRWRTSIFPDKKSGTYLLAIKAKIRQIENIKMGDQVRFMIEIDP